MTGLLQKSIFYPQMIIFQQTNKNTRDQRIWDPRPQIWIRKIRKCWIRNRINFLRSGSDKTLQIRDPNPRGSRTFVPKKRQIRKVSSKFRDSKNEFQVNFLNFGISKKFFQNDKRNFEMEKFRFWNPRSESKEMLLRSKYDIRIQWKTFQIRIRNPRNCSWK